MDAIRKIEAKPDKLGSSQVIFGGVSINTGVPVTTCRPTSFLIVNPPVENREKPITYFGNRLRICHESSHFDDNN